MIEVLMTVNQFAKFKNVHRRTVDRWCKTNKVRKLRSPNGKHWYILTEVEQELTALS